MINYNKNHWWLRINSWVLLSFISYKKISNFKILRYYKKIRQNFILHSSILLFIFTNQAPKRSYFQKPSKLFIFRIIFLFWSMFSLGWHPLRIDESWDCNLEFKQYNMTTYAKWKWAGHTTPPLISFFTMHQTP